MKHDAWPGEREILQFQVRDGDGLLTTHRLIIDTVKYSRRRKQMMQQPTEFYSLRDFQKAAIADETLYVYFWGWKMAIIRLRLYAPSILQEIKDYIEETAKYCE